MMDVIAKSSEHTAARMDFSGLAAIVTGSPSGIGLGIARVFADMGLSEEAVVRDVLLHAQPTRQFVTTEQIGALAAFVCTAAAASITGTALPVHGGRTAP